MALAQPGVGGVITPAALTQLLTGTAVGPLLAESLLTVATPLAQTLPIVVHHVVQVPSEDTLREGGAPQAAGVTRRTAATVLVGEA